MDGKSRKLFEKYYIELRKPVYWYIFRKVSNEVLAEDIASDVFIKLAENPNILKERDQNGVKAWVLTVARNKVIDYYRSKSTNSKKIDIDSEYFEVIASEDGEYLKEAIKDQNCKLVSDALQLLSGDEKEVVALRFKDEMKFSEIAEVLNKNEGAIKMTLYRALEKVKDNLEGQI